MGPVLPRRLLVLVWVCAAQAEVLVQPDFSAPKFSGLWYVVAVASDCQLFLAKKDHLLMFTSAINATAEGDLSAHMEFPWAEGCSQVDAIYLKVASEGHFRVPALHYLDVRVADTDYSTFAVVYIYKELVGALSTMVQLYSRTRDPAPKALSAFRSFYPTVGLQDFMVALLPKSDMCSPGHGGTPAPPETDATPTQEGAFSGLWYEVAFASKMGVLSSPHKLEKMAGVLIKLDGNHFSLSTTYFSEEGCVLEQVGAFPETPRGSSRSSGNLETKRLRFWTRTTSPTPS
ncbi:lipocalin-15 [Perognathus longimembris pacificus]|uniref:lipocalin-15 n=1 Tax=Perognathus longimembris pacificus TaxID=214514 RepID=UPI002019BE16|nr:lipocalin-15 [Perognathus longimembris pacificus]